MGVFIIHVHVNNGFTFVIHFYCFIAADQNTVKTELIATAQRIPIHKGDFIGL